MWDLIVKKKFPPTRLARYCCEYLKERNGQGRMKVTGVRWAESISRGANQGAITIIGKPETIKKIAGETNANFIKTDKGGVVLNDDNDASRRVVEACYRTSSTMVNPIIDWLDNEVWDFLKYYSCEGNPLYQCGFKRIGCIGCPLGGSASMKRGFQLYPKYRRNYVKAFDRMLIARAEAGLENRVSWRDGESVMRWWLGYDPAQMTIFDQEEYERLEWE